MKCFKAIAAMSENRVIGRGNKIPWHLPEDFKWFKKMTVGQVIIMGRKTFESIGRALPNRETIVLSRSGIEIPGIKTLPNWRVIDPQKDTREFFVCGGAQIYSEMLPYCSDLYLTLVKRVINDGDAFFPSCEEAFHHVGDLAECDDFVIRHFRNDSPLSCI